MAATAGIAAATQGVERQGAGTAPIHYLRALVPFTSEGLVAADERFGTNRHNPYLLPGALEKLDTQLEAFDCRNTENQLAAGRTGPAVRRRAEPRVPGPLDALPAAQEGALVSDHGSAIRLRDRRRRLGRLHPRQQAQR